MKLKDLRQKKEADLQKMLEDKQTALASFRFKISGGKVTNTKEGRNLRREIARLKTLLQEFKKQVSL